MSLTRFDFFFDSEGNPLTVDSEGNPLPQKGDIINALMKASTTAQPITDLWIFAYGWNNDIADGTQSYNQWHANMIAVIQNLQEQNKLPPNYQPRFVEIFWPSKAWVDDAAQPAITMAVAPEALLPAAAPDLLDRKAFQDAYRTAMDPQGVHGEQYDTDFGRIYDLMHLPQRPTNAELNEFVQILYKYKIEDPQSDPTEKNDVIHAQVDQIVQRLEGKPLISSLFKMGLTSDHALQAQPNLEQSIAENLLDFFRIFTFWTMKARSAVVGQSGVASFLMDLVNMNNNFSAQNLPPVRIHVLGHSFGAKVLAAAVKTLQQPSIATFV